MSEADISLTQIAVDFEVKNFFDLPLDCEYVIKFPPFSFFGGKYGLRLRPNGDEKRILVGWICLYLSKKYSPFKNGVGYTLGIKGADGSIFKYGEDYCLFPRDTRRFGKAIYPRSELLKRRNEVAPNGNLTIFCVLYLHCKSATEVTHRSEPLHTGFRTLSNDLKDLIISGKYGDITIKTRDKDIRAHRAVLAARSSVFHDMLEVENNDGVITIEDCDAECLESFLLFLYGGDLTVVLASNALALCNLAIKYDIPELKKVCLRHLLR